MTIDASLVTPLDDYELLDFGGGRKLERFGCWVTDRPAPQAAGKRALTRWSPDWTYTGSRVGGGVWQPARAGLAREWIINLDGQQMHCRLHDGGQLGVYPEHAACWRWVRARLGGSYHIDDLRVLNLFAGTGGATLAAVDSGAHVTHVDAQSAQIELAKRNVGERGARWLREDVMTFVERALRRGERYHMIIMDPPSFGRGPKGKVWDIKYDLQPLVKHLPRLITDDCLGIWLSLHSEDIAADSLAALLYEVLPGHTVEAWTLGTRSADARSLSAGVAAVWYDDHATLGLEHRQQPLSAVALEERLDVYLDAVLSSRRTAAGPAEELAKFERSQQDDVLRWVEIIARTNAEMAYQFAAYVPEALRAMDERSVEAWMLHAMDVFDTSGLHQGIAALKAVEACANEIEMRSHGVVFEDVAGMLELFVHGLSGRPLKLASGDETYTDSETIFLPSLTSRFALREDNFKLYKAMAVYQWAQCRFGSHRAEVVARLTQFPDAARELALFQVLERIRLDACVARELPGMHRDLRGLCGLAGQTLVPPGWEAVAARLSQAQASAEDSLALLERVARYEVPGPLCFEGRMFPERVQKVQALRLAREKEQLQLLLARLDEEQRRRREQSGDGAQRETPGEEVAPRLRWSEPDPERQESGAVYELLLDGEPVAPPVEAQGLMESIIQDLGEIPDDYLVPAGPGRYRAQHVAQGEDDPQGRDVWKGTYHEQGAFLYNEWDFKRKHYRKAWCVLRELDVHPHNEEFVVHTLRKHLGLVKNIRRTFEALRGEEKLLKKQANGENVDIDALVEAYADQSAGMEMSDRLFTKMQKVERNIAVMFMVDMSGSTKGWINDAERESLVLLCEALETLGDRYAIYGFSGWTRKRCELYRVKRFDEHYSDEVRARISGIKPQDYTRMGVTIRHLTQLLNAVDARTKLLITLSDGKPDDFDGYRGEYGIEDTRMALIEAKRSGIHPFCITIDREAHDYLPHMYGAVNYTLVDDVAKLPLKVSDIYRRLTS